MNTLQNKPIKLRPSGASSQEFQPVVGVPQAGSRIAQQNLVQQGQQSGAAASRKTAQRQKTTFPGTQKTGLLSEGGSPQHRNPLHLSEPELGRGRSSKHTQPSNNAVTPHHVSARAVPVRGS